MNANKSPIGGNDSRLDRHACRFFCLVMDMGRAVAMTAAYQSRHKWHRNFHLQLVRRLVEWWVVFVNRLYP